MVRSFAGSSIRGRLLAGILVLLALAFAMEAKMAWYGSGAGPGSDVRSAKAMPIDAPKLVSHGIPAPDPIHPQMAFAFLTFLAIALPFCSDLPSGGSSPRSGFRMVSSCFVPQSFRRPPPIL